MNRLESAVALGTGGAFLAIGLAVLSVDHPAGDAYIVFNAGGPRSEGASDFLWMLLLAAGVRLGLDVAIAALASYSGFSAMLYSAWLLAIAPRTSCSSTTPTRSTRERSPAPRPAAPASSR